MKYKSPISHGCEVTTKVKVFLSTKNDDNTDARDTTKALICHHKLTRVIRRQQCSQKDNQI